MKYGEMFHFFRKLIIRPFLIKTARKIRIYVKSHYKTFHLAYSINECSVTIIDQKNKRRITLLRKQFYRPHLF